MSGPPIVEPIPYRIRIGVTGHRSLPDPEVVMAAIKLTIDTKIDELFDPKSREKVARARETKSPEVLYSVVSPLAEGADRLVARAVLSYEGSRLQVVLPLKLEDYLEDFETPQSRAEFQELLSRCRMPVHLRRRSIADEARDGNDPGELRRAAYESVGHYVVNHCDVLLALWDGKESRGRGGTAEIVEFAKAQGRPVIRIWAESGKPIIETWSPDEKRPSDGLDATALDRVIEFNSRQASEGLRAEYVASLERDYFETPPSAVGLPEEARNLVRVHLFPYYVQASLGAKQYQRKFYAAGKAVYLLSALSVASVAFAVLVPQFSVFLYGAELLMLVLMWWWVHRALSQNAQENWMENRFLTERIRSGIFLAICGVDPSPIEVLPFMGHAHAVNDWMVRVFDEIWNRLPKLAWCDGASCTQLNQYVSAVWLQGQLEFHKRKRDREARIGNLLVRIGKSLLPVTIFAAAFHVAWSFLPSKIHHWHWPHDVLTFIAIAFPAFGASIAGMRAHREYLRLEMRSRSMIHQLEYLNRRLASTTDPKAFAMLLLQVDELMLRETQDWLMLMRYVEVEAS